MEEGLRHVRIQLGGYGGVGTVGSNPDFKDAGFGMANDSYMDDQAYLKAIPKVLKLSEKDAEKKLSCVMIFMNAASQWM